MEDSFINDVREIVSETVSGIFDSFRGLWDTIKFKVKDYAIRYGKNERKVRDFEKRKVQNYIVTIKKIPDFIDNSRYLVYEKKYLTAKLN